MRTAILCLVIAFTVFGERIFVSTSGSTSGDGSVSAPYDSVARGINEAAEGDTVIMEDGVYNQYAIYGQKKNFVLASRFILDGQTSHIANTVIDAGVGSPWTVFFLDSLTYLTRFVGFTIRNGRRAFYNMNTGESELTLEYVHVYGCVVSMGWRGNYHIYHCEIYDNGSTGEESANGGVITQGISGYLEDTKIYNNTAQARGGGFYEGTYNLNRCEIYGNSAGYEGGVFYDCWVTMDSCTVYDNFAGYRGGVISFYTAGEDAVITNSDLYNNYTDTSTVNCKGAITYGGTAEFTNCDIHGNLTRYGAVGSNSALTFNFCELYDNTEFTTKLFNSGVQTLTNCGIYNNTGLILDSLGPMGTETYINCTFSGNSRWTLPYEGNRMTLANCIVNDTIQKNLKVPFTGYPLITYSMIKEFVGDQIDASSIGNIFGMDPYFIDEAGDDYHLKQYSPAVDAGDPASDCSLEPFVWGVPRINMGRYGNTTEAATPGFPDAHMVFSFTNKLLTMRTNEIFYDTLYVINEAGPDPVIILDTSDIEVVSPNQIAIEGMSRTFTGLKAGDTCAIYLRIQNVQASGQYSLTVNFNAMHSGNTISYNVTRNGVFDDVFQNTWSFPETPIGTSVIDTFYLKNFGSNTISVADISESHEVLSGLSLLSGSFPLQLAPGDSIGLRATFLPQTNTTYQIPISISTPNVTGGVDNTLQASCPGINTVLTVSPNLVTFNPTLLGETDSALLTIRNDESISLTVNSFVFSNPVFSISDASSFTLTQNSVRTLWLRYSPAATGTQSGTLTINNSSTGTPAYQVSMSGTGVASAVTGLSGTSIQFGNIPAGTFKDDSVLVTNTGNGTLKIDSIRSNHEWFIVLGNDDYREVAPAASFYLSVRFSPLQQSAQLTQVVSVFSNASGSPHTLSVVGTGTQTDVTTEVNSIDFGRVTLNSTTDTTVVISNAGNGTVTITGSSSNEDAFVVGSLPASVAGGGSETFTITFEPTEAVGQHYSGIITVTHSDGSVNITVSGDVVSDPYCSITEITPQSVAWDTSTNITFLASADDSDDVGGGARIVTYLWESSLAGAFGMNSNSFAFSSSNLGIGVHQISLRVVDNEGDTSAPAGATLTVLGRKPYAEIVSVNPSGLIIKGSGNVTFSGQGYDLDEYANASNDSLKSFSWYSDINGLLGQGKTLAVNSSVLEIGVHYFYAAAVDDDGDTTVTDSLPVSVQTDIGRVVIVAGTAFDDYLYFFNNISPNCNWAYKKLLDRGFTDDHIFYMNPVGWQTIGDPYANSNIVDTTRMTLSVLRDYLLDEAVVNDVSNDVPLIIYLLGHGSSAQQSGKFYLSPEESLTPDTLAEWLNTYGDLTSGNSQIIVILDFCYSGTFQQRLRTALDQNRVVITSADAENAAYFSGGRCFSWNLWYEVYRGGNLSQAFLSGKGWSDNHAPGANLANPQINSDNNSEYNTGIDLAIAEGIYIGGSQQLQALSGTIDSVWFVQEDFNVVSRAKGSFTAMWARVYPPDFDYTSGNIGSLPVILLEQSDDSTWSGAYSGDWVVGQYLFRVEGMDADGNLVMGRSVTFDAGSARVKPGPLAPAVLFLSRNFPNPFTGRTQINFGVPDETRVRLDIYNMHGRLITTLIEGRYKAGSYCVQWDGRDSRGAIVGSGYYIYKFYAGDKRLSGEMVLIR